MFSQITQKLQAFHLCPLDRYHPNQTPPTLVSLYTHSCLHLKFNMYSTKFNYLVHKPDSPLYSFYSITSFSQGPKLSNSITNSVHFWVPSHLFHCSHQGCYSSYPISLSLHQLQSLIANSTFPKHHWIKATPYIHNKNSCCLLN